MTMPAFLAAFFLIAAQAGLALAAGEIIATQKVQLRAEILHEGLQHPWGLDFLPDGLALVTERGGRMQVLYPDGGRVEVAGVPAVAASGQGGLLDIAAGPNFASDGMIWFSFAEAGEGGAGTAIARARLVLGENSAALEDVETIFSMQRKTGATHHFGSRLFFHPDGTLFFTTGDRGEADRAQDFSDHAGAVLRILPDGGIPRDNPFADGARGLPEIWSKGHRNPQGAIHDPFSGKVLTVEHGARGGDEVNVPEAGLNYGWPVISYGRHYSGFRIGIGKQAPGYEQPVHYWDPSIAPSGLAVYDGAMFPEWQGDLLVGALRAELVTRLERDDEHRIVGEESMLEGRFGRIRDVNVAPDGSIWLLTDEADGAIIRLSRAK